MEKLNIAELLKNCPTGMELDCMMFEDVYFDHISDCGKFIHCYINYEDRKTSISFNKYGAYCNLDKSKCVLFPKGKTTWEEFVPPCKFKDGDVLTYMYHNKPTIYIYRENGCCNTSYYAGYSFANESFYKGTIGGLSGNRTDLRLATEDEKQKLFQFIKDNGYKWNPETKTLEKLIKPIFKVGDKVQRKEDIREKKIIDNVLHDCYTVQGYGVIFFTAQDEWELVPNKFDITTLKPFESRILVRNTEEDIWKPAIFGCYMKDKSAPYYTLGSICWRYCIPYEGNERLLGKTDDCDEYYKTWEK